jgi:uncharacterized protein
MVPLVKQSAMLPIPASGSLRLAVVADTHGEPHAGTAKYLATLKPDAILHAGDIGDLAVLDGLRKIAPLYAIRGNIDTRAQDLPDLLTLELGDRLRLLLMHIAVNGPRLRADAIRHARAAKASLVVCGHSHVPFIGQDRDLAVFNPGSVGPRRFQLPIVFGTIDVTPTGIRFAHHNCETQTPWSPP